MNNPIRLPFDWLALRSQIFANMGSITRFNQYRDVASLEVLVYQANSRSESAGHKAAVVSLDDNRGVPRILRQATAVTPMEAMQELLRDLMVELAECFERRERE